MFCKEQGGGGKGRATKKTFEARKKNSEKKCATKLEGGLWP